MASPYRYEERILKAASEHFALHGFFGARVDNIAEEAKLNKRMVYEYNHTKEGLYLAVLSRVSRDVMAQFDEKLPLLDESCALRSTLEKMFSLFAESSTFVRLWAWEEMDETIHGPRILETASSLFDRLNQCIRKCAEQGKCRSIDSAEFDEIVALCHGYLLSLSLYLGKVRRENENSESDNLSGENGLSEQAQPQEDDNRLSVKDLQVVRDLQDTVVNMICNKLCLKV